jgi:hypothetical protein
MDTKPKLPFRVDIVDQFQGHDEYRYDLVGTYDTLDEVIAVAKQVMDEAIAQFDPLEDWYGMGDAGLVYDSTEGLSTMEFRRPEGSVGKLNHLKNMWGINSRTLLRISFGQPTPQSGR